MELTLVVGQHSCALTVQAAASEKGKLSTQFMGVFGVLLEMLDISGNALEEGCIVSGAGVVPKEHGRPPADA